MPIHDWTRVAAGIYHHFHHAWIEELARTLNAEVLKGQYYAMAEQATGGFGPDVLTLQSRRGGELSAKGLDSDAPVATLRKPKAKFSAKSEAQFLTGKKSTIAVRHVSEDDVVAVIEILSPGNKDSRAAFNSLLEKACELLKAGVHLLVIDLFPPSKRDPRGVHSALWEEITSEVFEPPADKPLTLVAYEASRMLRAFIEPVAVGDALPDMPLILQFDGAVDVPLERTYQGAWMAVPERWRREIEAVR